MTKDELKKEFEDFTRKSIETDMNCMFREWVFMKLAQLSHKSDIEDALEQCRKWKMTDEELKNLME